MRIGNELEEEQMSSNYGEQLKISIFGQSHAEGIGVVIDGVPAGHKIDMNKLQEHLNRRAPGNSEYATPRKEADKPEFLSGIVDGITCGAPICAVVCNTNTRAKDYEKQKEVPRPGHADYTAMIRHGGFQDVRGGGHFSGRLTAPLCIAGGICMQILAEQGIRIKADISAIAGVKGSEDEMLAKILEAKEAGDSVGGIIKAKVTGMPVGIGEPMFEGIEGKLAQALFAIPAVKGVEFGRGFEAAKIYGSENNDDFYYDENGQVKTRTNNHGGILGGMSSGMPITMQVAFKPTPSIVKEQESINIKTKQIDKLVIEGRHDPCIVPRALPCVESAVAIALLDLLWMKH